MPRPILPPYILERIAQHGTPAQRAAAQRTLDLDAGIRQARAATAARDGAPATAPAATATPDRTISDAAHGTDVTGLDTLRAEGEPPTGDAAADEAYDGLGATFTFWQDVFGRRSIDDAGLPLR